VESLIDDYISREFVQAPALLPLVNDTSLPETGILSSLSMLSVVAFLEEPLGITAEEEDLLPQNFAGVNTICGRRRAREPGRQEAAHG
jgi:acyl carrier protein